MNTGKNTPLGIGRATANAVKSSYREKRQQTKRVYHFSVKLAVKIEAYSMCNIKQILTLNTMKRSSDTHRLGLPHCLTI